MRPARRLVCWIAGIGLICCTSRHSFAQQEPVHYPWFNLTRMDGALFMDAQYRQQEEQRGRGRGRFDENTLLLREGVELDLGGHIYHPNLLLFDTSLRVGASHEWLHLNDEKRVSEGLLLGYNFNALALREKPVSARVYASMVDDVINRSFAQPIDLESSIQGGELWFKGDFPVTLLYEHETRLESNEIRINDRETHLFRATVEDRRDRDWFSRLMYQYYTTEETSTFHTIGATTLDLPDEQHELRFENRWRFGDPLLPHQLNGTIRHAQRSGFFENEITQFNQRLDLAHTKKFSSFYVGRFFRNETLSQFDQTLHGEAGFRASVYDSLDITAWTLIQKRDIDDGYEDEFGGFIELDYRKHTPIGFYDSNLALGWTINEEGFEQGMNDILDELLVLRGGGGVTLSQPNVLANSIRVTNSTNTVIYVEGIDYIVRQFGSLVEIVRLPGGSIGVGEKVLVDYTAQAGTEAEYERRQLSWGHRLTLDPYPVTLFGRYRLVDEHLTGGDNPGNLDREQSQLVGVTYHPDNLSMTGEYEMRRHRIFPSWNAWRVRGTYSHLINNSTSLHATVGYEDLQYLDGTEFGLESGRDYLQTMDAAVNLDTRLTRNLLSRLELSYRESAGRQEDTLTRIASELQWLYGRVEMSFDARYEIYSIEEDEGSRVFVGFKLRREF